jgi:PhnB protein
VAKKATKASTKAPAKTKPAAKKAPAKAAKPAKPTKAAKPDKAPRAKAPSAPAASAPGAPAGQHSLTSHLVVRGAAMAIEFYKHAFGGTEVFRMPGPDGFTLAHAHIKIGDSDLFLADESPQMGDCKSPPSLGGTTSSVHLYVEDADAVVKKAEDQGARVVMPPADMFWGDRFGKIIDPFGHHWSIATHKEDLSPQEMGKRAAAFYTTMQQPPE